MSKRRPSRAAARVVDVGGHELGVELRLRRRSPRAASIAGSEKSSPVTRAPSRAQDSESRPKWHWRCTRRAPVDVADLLELERAQRVRAGLEGLDVVEVARHVQRNALVPPRAVQVAHALSVSRRGPAGSPARSAARPRRADHRLAVEALDPEPRHPPAPHGLGQRLQRGSQPAPRPRLAQRHQALAAALDVEHRLGVERDHVRAGHARGPARSSRRRASATAAWRRRGWPGRSRPAPAAPAGSSVRIVRSRSTAAGSANCAPPRPSTK